MLARVSTLHGKEAQIEQGIQQFRRQTIPEARGMQGFKGAYLLVDRKSGKAVSITLWDSERDLQVGSASTDQVRKQATRAIETITLPTVEVFEVAAES